MNAQAKSDLKLMQDESEWLYAKRENDSFAFCWCFRGETFEWHADANHPEDLQFVLKALGIYASDPDSQVSWYRAAILSQWFRQIFYGGL